MAICYTVPGENHGRKVDDMPECSLCGDTMDPNGGAVVFVDGRGIPFEVCGKCEGYFELLQNANFEEETNRALDYISSCVDNIKYKGAYDSLMEFIESEMPPKEP